MEIGKRTAPVATEFQQGETFNVILTVTMDMDAGTQGLIEVYDYLPFSAMQIISVSIGFENIYPDTVSLWFDTYQISFMGITTLANVSVTSKVEINYTVLCSAEGSWYLPEATMSVDWFEFGEYIGGSLHWSNPIGPLTIISRSEKRLMDSIEASEENMIAALEALKEEVLTALDASKEDVLADLDGIELDLEDIEAKVLGIRDDVTAVSSDLGGMRIALSDVGARIVGLEDSSDTILTSLGEVSMEMETLDAKVTDIEAETTDISTTLGEVEETVLDVEEDTSTLLADLETVKADLGHDIEETEKDIKELITGLVYPLLLATVALAASSLTVLVYVIIRLRKVSPKQT